MLGAVALFIRGDDNAAIQVLLPTLLKKPRALPVFQAVASSLVTAAAQTELKVYVSGAVHNPGVYTLRQDDRLSDAVNRGRRRHG